MSEICEPMWKWRSLKQWSQPSARKQLDRRQQLGGGKAELRVIAARSLPLAAAFGMQPDADAEIGLDADLAGDAEDLAELRELLDDEDDALAEPLAGERDADEERVLVAVADDQPLGAAHHRERGEQLRLAARLEAEVVRRAGVEDLLDDLAQLVHLDREHPLISSLVAELGDRAAKRFVDRLDAVAEDVLEADHQRQPQAPALRFLDDVDDLDRAALLLLRRDGDVALVVDVEVLDAPAPDVVRLQGISLAP